MKKKILILMSTASILFADTKPPEAPESPGIQQQKLDEIDKSVVTSKTKKAIIDTLEVNKDTLGVGENRIKGPSFVLSNVSISGNTTFEQNKIIDIIRPYVSKKVDSLDLKYIAQKVTQLYKENGYVTSKCIIPAQKVANGKVKFQIIEDKLGRVILQGKTTYNYDQNIFMRYLADLQGKIINADELNNRLKILSNLPVTRIQPSLQKTNKGFTNLILNITEGQERFSISTDNSGSAYTGKQRITFNGNINNIRGKSDSLSLSLTTVKDTEHLTSFSSSYVTPFGKHGGRISFGYSHMYYQLDSEEIGSDMVIYEGETDILSVNYGQPLYWLDNANLSFNYGYEKKDVTAKTIQNKNEMNDDNVSTGGGDILVNGVDSLFVLNASVNYSKADIALSDKYTGVNSISFSVKKALEGFWNSMTQEDLDRKESDTSFPLSGPIKYGKGLNPAFLKYYYNLSRKQQLPWEVTSTARFSGNYTNSRVPDSYEYSGGDYGFAYSLLFAKKMGIVNSSLSLSRSKVYTYSSDDMSISTEKNAPSAGISLSGTYKDIYLSLSYSSSLDTWDSNTNNIRANLKYSW